jgi:hypothetical protein
MSDPNFQPVEIDLLDKKLAETATRKRIPTLHVAADSAPMDDHPGEIVQPQPGNMAAPRKPLSVEVPDYLATALKVAAAQKSVTVRHLILNALVDAGFDVRAIDREEDGRRLR